MIDIIVKKDGNTAFYAQVKPSKKGEQTVYIQGYGQKMRPVGEIEIEEEDGIGGVLKKVINLLEEVSPS